jgi:hypothetical protein
VGSLLGPPVSRVLTLVPMSWDDRVQGRRDFGLDLGPAVATGVVADVVLKAASAARPKLRYPAGVVATRIRAWSRLAPTVSAFLRSHPAVRVDVFLTARYVDLVKGGVRPRGAGGRTHRLVAARAEDRRHRARAVRVARVPRHGGPAAATRAGRSGAHCGTGPDRAPNGRVVGPPHRRKSPARAAQQRCDGRQCALWSCAITARRRSSPRPGGCSPRRSPRRPRPRRRARG